MSLVTPTPKAIREITRRVADATELDDEDLHFDTRGGIPHVEIYAGVTLPQLLAIAAGLARIAEIQQDDQPKEKKPCKSESAGSCT